MKFTTQTWYMLFATPTSELSENVENLDGFEVVDVDIRHPEVVNEAEVDGNVGVVLRGRRPEHAGLLPTDLREQKSRS